VWWRAVEEVIHCKSLIEIDILSHKFIYDYYIT
jgi:hypothetical protein